MIFFYFSLLRIDVACIVESKPISLEFIAFNFKSRLANNVMSIVKREREKEKENASDEKAASIRLRFLLEQKMTK